MMQVQIKSVNKKFSEKKLTPYRFQFHIHAYQFPFHILSAGLKDILFRVDLDGDVVENLIDFTYTGTIELTLVEVQAMLVAAHQLKFITVIRVSAFFRFI